MGFVVVFFLFILGVPGLLIGLVAAFAVAQTWPAKERAAGCVAVVGAALLTVAGMSMEAVAVGAALYQGPGDVSGFISVIGWLATGPGLGAGMGLLWARSRSLVLPAYWLIAISGSALTIGSALCLVFFRTGDRYSGYFPSWAAVAASMLAPALVLVAASRWVRRKLSGGEPGQAQA